MRDKNTFQRLVIITVSVLLNYIWLGAVRLFYTVRQAHASTPKEITCTEQKRPDRTCDKPHSIYSRNLLRNGEYCKYSSYRTDARIIVSILKGLPLC